MQLTSTRLRITAALVLAGTALSVGQPAGADAIEETAECSQFTLDDNQPRTDAPSSPARLLDVAAAHDLLRSTGRAPGSGVGVAVVDSGVTTRSGLLDVRPGASFGKQGQLLDFHGSAVAGLIAGRPRANGNLVGLAPGASIIDVRVYDTADPTDNTQAGIDTDLVAAGLEWVAANADRAGIKVANVSLSVASSPRLEAAVEAVRAQDVIVVAASGNRPGEGDRLYADFGQVSPGEDAAAAVYPAGYPEVLAVSATAGGYGEEGEESFDVVQAILPSSAIDVAAPTYGAVSFAINGGTCVLNEIATSWAAAEVSGLAALLWSRFPEESDEQIMARLVATADGTLAQPTPLRGAGVVQPVEALTRPLAPDRSGDLGSSTPVDAEVPRAQAPDPETDPLALVRDRTVWWGLLCGGVVVLALLLRPLLRRQR